MTPPPAEPSPSTKLPAPATPIVAPETFGSSAHSLSVNQEYTDHLKSAIGIGLMQQNSKPVVEQQPISKAVVNTTTPTVDFFHQMSQYQQSMATSRGSDASECQQAYC